MLYFHEKNYTSVSRYADAVVCLYMSEGRRASFDDILDDPTKLQQMYEHLGLSGYSLSDWTNMIVSDWPDVLIEDVTRDDIEAAMGRLYSDVRDAFWAPEPQ